jgi:hypothetical protein
VCTRKCHAGAHGMHGGGIGTLSGCHSWRVYASLSFTTITEMVSPSSWRFVKAARCVGIQSANLCMRRAYSSPTTAESRTYRLSCYHSCGERRRDAGAAGLRQRPDSRGARRCSPCPAS